MLALRTTVIRVFLDFEYVIGATPRLLLLSLGGLGSLSGLRIHLSLSKKNDEELSNHSIVRICC